jgi:hypothetical protein
MAGEAQAAPAFRNGTTLPVYQGEGNSILTPCASFRWKATDIFRLQSVDISAEFPVAPTRSLPPIAAKTLSEATLEEHQLCKPIHIAGFYTAFNTYRIRNRRTTPIRVRGPPNLFSHHGTLLRNPADVTQYLEDRIDAELHREPFEMPSSCKDIS